MVEGPTCCEVPPSTPRRWHRDKTVLTVAVLGLLMLVSYRVPALSVFRHNVVLYLRVIGLAVVLGFLIGGLLERYVPREYISMLLAQGKKRSILYAVMLGFLMSACSHGILALSIELHKKGASGPVVVSFLLASPWANLPITFILIGFFGLKALFMIGAALIIAFVTGVFFQFLEKKGLIESNKNTLIVHESYSMREDILRRVKGARFSMSKLRQDGTAILRGAFALADMTLWWILIGIGLSGLLAAFIPQHFFHRYMGPTVPGLLVTLGLATVMEVCSEGTSPLAFEIYKQTGAFGNAFVFLMAGVVTDFTEIGLLWSNVGKKTAVWLPIVTVPQVVLFGFLANKIF